MENWYKKIEKEQKKYIIKQDANLIAHTLMLWEKYSPTEKTNIEEIYGDIIESQIVFNKQEEKEIKQLARKILKEKYNLKDTP